MICGRPLRLVVRSDVTQAELLSLLKRHCKAGRDCRVGETVPPLRSSASDGGGGKGWVATMREVGEIFADLVGRAMETSERNGDDQRSVVAVAFPEASSRLRYCLDFTEPCF